MGPFSVETLECFGHKRYIYKFNYERRFSKAQNEYCVICC